MSRSNQMAEVETRRTRRKHIIILITSIIFLFIFLIAIEAVVTFHQVIEISDHETAAYQSLTTVKSDIQSAIDRSNITDLEESFNPPDLIQARQQTAQADKISHNANLRFLSRLPLTKNDVTALQTLTGSAYAITHQVLTDYQKAVSPFSQIIQDLSSRKVTASDLQNIQRSIADAENNSQTSLSKASSTLKTLSRRLSTMPRAHIGLINVAVSQVRGPISELSKQTASLNVKNMVHSAIISALSEADLPTSLAAALGV